VHRADLHALLLNAVKQFPQAHLQLDSEVASFSQSDAAISIVVNAPGHTSKTQSGDVLIGADGLWSQVRSQLLNDGPPQATGRVAYRAMLLQKDLPANLRSKAITAWLGPKMHAVQYPVRGGEWLNVVVIVESGGTAASNSWNQAFGGQIMPEALLEKRSQLSKILQFVGAWQAWPLCARAPMRSAQAHFPVNDAQNKVNTRVALLGDAAHPMLPYLAQGAGMAIEDANELATCLAGGEDVAKALQNYAENRWQRNARVQARAIRNGRIFHATGLVKLGRNLAMKMLGERILDLPWLYSAS
jgi:salicylate hydroxylase